MGNHIDIWVQDLYMKHYCGKVWLHNDRPCAGNGCQRSLDHTGKHTHFPKNKSFIFNQSNKSILICFICFQVQLITWSKHVPFLHCWLAHSSMFCSQNCPVYPGLQRHFRSNNVSTQLPLTHGLGLHKSSLMWHLLP